MKKKDLMLLANLRANARATLTSISKKVQMPISTIFDRLKSHQDGVIKKHTTLVDFSKLGYKTRAHLTVKVNKSDREKLRSYLGKHFNVNTVYKINNGYDFLAEVIFKELKQMEDFVEELEEKFKIRGKNIFYIIEDIKRENFLSDPELLKFNCK